MTRQISSLTGVRGVAALWVAVMHGNGYAPAEAVLPTAVYNAMNIGWLGVDLFFLLSGFVIAYVHQADFVHLSARNYAQFIKLRIARIYPAHFVATIVLIPIVLGASLLSVYEAPDDKYSSSRLLFSLSLLNGWGFPDSIGWNVPSWSVGSEWFAYLCFPFIALVLNRIRSTLAHFGIIVSTFAVMVALAAILNDFRQYMLGHEWMLTRVTSEFLIGCSLYTIYRNTSDHTAFDWVALCAALLVVVLAVARIPGIYHFVIIAAFSLMILALSRSVAFSARLFSCSPLRYLGKISYSIYLVHATVLMVVNQILLRVLRPVVEDVTYYFAFFAIYLTCVIIAGHILYALVEQPARNFLRERWVMPIPERVVAK